MILFGSICSTPNKHYLVTGGKYLIFDGKRNKWHVTKRTNPM
jgi:hypothetical protein